MEHPLHKLPPYGEAIWGEITKVAVFALNKVHDLVAKATATQQACGILADTTFVYADAALCVCDRKLWRPADALLRTCVECQSRADYIVHLDPQTREEEAKDFLNLATLHDAKSYERVINASETSDHTIGNLPFVMAANWLNKEQMEALKGRLKEIMDGSWLGLFLLI